MTQCDMEGGADSGALPQFLFGVGPITNSRVPPLAIAACSNHGVFRGLPLQIGYKHFPLSFSQLQLQNLFRCPRLLPVSSGDESSPVKRMSALVLRPTLPENLQARSPYRFPCVLPV
jgi:hypothetical protein